MATPLTVACWVRNAGVWKRTLPYQHNGTGHVASKQVFTKASSVWKTSWADAERALGGSAASLFDIDFSSPYSTAVGWKMLTDGRTQSFEGAASYADRTDPWLKYDTTQHLYQVKFADNATHNLDTVPTLSTFLDAESIVYEFTSARTAPGVESGGFTVTWIDRAAPGPAPVIRTFSLDLEIEVDTGA